MEVRKADMGYNQLLKIYKEISYEKIRFGWWNGTGINNSVLS